MTRRKSVRLTGGETEAQRAHRLADVDLEGWLAHVKLARPSYRPNYRIARMTGFVAGYLACLEDEVEK